MYYDYSWNTYAKSCSEADISAVERMEQMLTEHQEVMVSCSGVDPMAVIDAIKSTGYTLISTDLSTGLLKFFKGSKQAVFGYVPIGAGVSCLAIKLTTVAAYMFDLSEFVPKTGERLTNASAAEQAIKKLTERLPSSNSEIVLAACTGFSDGSILHALKCLGYTIKKRFFGEGAILLGSADGSEALLGYRPKPTSADINKSYLMLELSA